MIVNQLINGKKSFLVIAYTILFCFSIHAQSTGEKFYDEVFYEDFSETVDPQVWHILTGNEHGGDLSRERCYVENGLLNMVFINDAVNGYLSSAIQTRKEFLYGRWEASIKPTNVPGVLNSFYTIDWDNTTDKTSGSDGTKQEIDIEFLTKSFNDKSGEVHFAVHESGQESFQTNPDIRIDFNPSSDFHVWGFEITPEYIEWFVDDTILHKYVYNENDITIDAPYLLKLNFWSAEKWIGGPPQEDVECIYQIDWIKFTPLRLLKKD